MTTAFSDLILEYESRAAWEPLEVSKGAVEPIRWPSAPFMTKRRRVSHGVEYRDEGCNLHPACLSCPLDRCQFEDSERRAMLPTKVSAQTRLELEVERLRAAGLT